MAMPDSIVARAILGNIKVMKVCMICAEMCARMAGFGQQLGGPCDAVRQQQPGQGVQEGHEGGHCPPHQAGAQGASHLNYLHLSAAARKQKAQSSLSASWMYLK